MEKNYIILNKFYNIYKQWAYIHKIIFKLNKYKLIHLLKRLKKFNIKIIFIIKDYTVTLKINI